MFHPLRDIVLVINVLAKAVRPRTWTKACGSVHIIVTTVPSSHLMRRPPSALKTSSSFSLHLLPLIWHSPGLQNKYTPPTCFQRPRPHADRRHTDAAIPKNTDKTKSKALMDGRSSGRGQGCIHPPFFPCLVSQHCLHGGIHLCLCVVETLTRPHVTQLW